MCALHDFVCDHCGTTMCDVYRSIEIGATADPPPCPACNHLMEWVPRVGAIDSYEPFQEFSHQLADGTSVHIDSLHKLRQVEREAEQRARNGEGEPLVWRDYSQNRSNRDEHSIMKTDPSERPSKTFLAKKGKLSTLHGEPTVTFGPGATEADASALGEDS